MIGTLIQQLTLRTILILLFGFMLGLSACQPSLSNETDVTRPEDVETVPFSETAVLFNINPEESEARFFIDEVLRGDDKTVVGVTNQVAGQIGVDFENPAATAVGPIQVSTRTLATDNSFRNRAIQNRILLTGLYEFVTFTPTKINGLPAAISPGERVTFEMAGDLTITAYSQPATFLVTAVLTSEDRLEGSAATTIQRKPFDLRIPSATGVAEVSEDVILELDFVAVRDNG